MTNDKISRLRANKKNKCSRCIIEAKLLNRSSSFCADAALWCFQTTGISIHPASTENTQYIANSRKKGRLYCQTSQWSNLSIKTTCKIQREISQCHGHRSPGDFFKKRISWLRVNIRYRYFTALIDWDLKRLLKLIVFWFQTWHILMVRKQSM